METTGNYVFTTEECAWAQTKIQVLGRTIIGLRGFSIKKGIDKEVLFAAGDEGIDIQTGNKQITGSLTVLKYEWDKMNDAALVAGYGDILEVPHVGIVITCQYKKYVTSKTRTITVLGVAFTDDEVAMQQNAKMTEIQLPFLALKRIVA